MKSFALVNPRTLDQALELLSEPRSRERVRPLAGGQDLLTEMKEHLAEPEKLVNLKGLPGLDRIVESGGKLEIGALVTLRALAEHALVRERMPALVAAARSIASPQIQSVGTVGGNLCQRPRCWYYRLEGARCIKKGGAKCMSYDGENKYNAILGGGPSYIVHPSDLAPMLVALDAEIVLRKKAGERRMPLESFFTLPSEGSVLRENVLDEGELVTAVVVPMPAPGARATYVKFKERGSFDFALASVALAVVRDGDTVSSARLVLGGVAPVPWRSQAAERALAGKKLDDDSARAAGEAALKDAEPLSQNAYKVPLAKGLIVKAARELRG